MKKGTRTSCIRRIIGDILLVLTVLLLIDAAFVMPAKIHAVIQKADYQEVFMYEMILCMILLLFALDIRFNLFTRWKSAMLRAVGWFLRTAIVLFSAVIIFLCGKVIIGSMVNTAGQADYGIVLGLALENGEPALTCWQDWTQPGNIWSGILKHS